MLTIRAGQKEILARNSFETWLLDHSHRFFAAECAQLGVAGTLAFVREMVGRARRNGLTGGPEVCSYLDLAFTFGRDFETEPWAAELVSEAGGHWNEFTMDALHEAALAELDPEAGLEAEDEDDFQPDDEDDEEDEEDFQPDEEEDEEDDFGEFDLEDFELDDADSPHPESAVGEATR